MSDTKNSTNIPSENKSPEAVSKIKKGLELYNKINENLTKEQKANLKKGFLGLWTALKDKSKRNFANISASLALIIAVGMSVWNSTTMPSVEGLATTEDVSGVSTEVTIVDEKVAILDSLRIVLEKELIEAQLITSKFEATPNGVTVK